jgi:hypothetical protein
MRRLRLTCHLETQARPVRAHSPQPRKKGLGASLTVTRAPTAILLRGPVLGLGRSERAIRQVDIGDLGNRGRAPRMSG